MNLKGNLTLNYFIFVAIGLIALYARRVTTAPISASTIPLVVTTPNNIASNEL